MSKLQVGDWVQCRYYNRPEKKFYGETFLGVITAIGAGQYQVRSGQKSVWLHRNEIKRRVIKIVEMDSDDLTNIEMQDWNEN